MEGPAFSAAVCGYTVPLAKRVESLADPGRIYITDNTAALLGETLELQDMGLFEVKGASAPVGVYDLLGRRADRTD